jgi:rubrerythrin
MDFSKCSMSQDGILLNLQKGLESEIRCRDLCKNLLSYLDDENDKKVIEKIMKDEEEHMKITEELISVTRAFYNN